MKALRNYLDNVKPNFEKGGKYEKFHSTFEAFESFLFAPATTNQGGVHVRDGVDLKRVISMVILALIPATIFGIWNSGYQYFNLIHQEASTLDCFLHGLYIFLPMVVVSYVVGLGIEFATAQIRGEQVNEGFLATGLLIPLVLPAGVPLWMVAVATAFSVIFAKEVFGGTGMNIWNPALIARAFLFFAYPSKMSGDSVWYYGDKLDNLDGATGATALAKAQIGDYVSTLDAFIGTIPGSIGETSALCILIGGLFLLLTGVASWKTMISVFVGGALTAFLFNEFGPATGIAQLPWYDHLFYGGFCFGAVFMATDPVTSCRTECGKYIYGLLIGFMAIVIRVLNPGYPEGMMLAILLMNTLAPLIDYVIVDRNISRRKKRAIVSK